MKRLIMTLALLAAVVAPSVQAVELKAKDQSGDARIALSAPSSLKQGKNTFTLSLKDKSGKPLAAKDVKVEATMSEREMDTMGMKGMGGGSAKTEVTPGKAPGTFDVKTNLPFGGNWQMKVSFKQPLTSAVFIVPVK